MRLVAAISLISIPDSVAEIERVAQLGLRALKLHRDARGMDAAKTRQRAPR